MKKLLGIVVLGLLLVSNVYGETVDQKRNHYIYNNLSMDYNACQHYFLIMSEALKTNDSDPSKVKNFVDSSKLASQLAFSYGVDAGLTNEAMLARSKILINEMLKSINNDFTNIEINESENNNGSRPSRRSRIQYTNFCFRPVYQKQSDRLATNCKNFSV